MATMDVFLGYGLACWFFFLILETGKFKVNLGGFCDVPMLAAGGLVLVTKSFVHV